MTKIQFGTDGWRAVIADEFTFKNVARVAQASADYWKSHPPPRTHQSVVVGYDRRFLSDRFARLVAEVIAANGFRVTLTSKPTPTPAVSHAIARQRAVGGIMITASHNPAAFNGFKLKAHFGGAADSALCEQVEQCLDRIPPRRLDGTKPSKIHVQDVCPAYFRAIKQLVDFPLIARSGLRFAHDALFGVGAGCFDELLLDTTCRVTTINGEHDPNFGGINPEPVAANYGRASAYLKKHPHNFCLVTDGDADRLGGMDGKGNPLSTHQVICLLLDHMLRNRSGTGRVVKALTTTAMVDKICQEYGLPLTVTPVGFKHITAEMLKGDVLLGAEESGGIGFPHHIPERDGILGGLMLLEYLATERQSINRLLARLNRRYGPHHYARIDPHFPLEKRQALMDFCRAQPPDRLLRSPVEQVQDFDGVKFIARDTSWLMLRGSGTEPVLRIYAEARSPADAQKLLRLGQRLARQV